MTSSTDNVQVLSLPAGTRQYISKQFTEARGRTFTVSIGIIRGHKPGPVLAHVAGQHGMEHIGPMVLRDFFDEIDPADVSGTLLLCPCANPLAMELDEEVYVEFDEAASLTGARSREGLGLYNMNRIWPNHENKGVVGQIVSWLWRTMIEPAHIVVDHHSVKQSLKPYIFVEQPSIGWTPYLGMEGVWCTGKLQPSPLDYPYRRLGMAAQAAGKIGLVIEYSRQKAISEPDRQLGRWCTLNLMKAMGMLEGEPVVRTPVWLINGDGGPYWEDGMHEIKTGHVGHAHYFVDEYEPITEGQPLCEIRSLETNDVLETIRSPGDGLFLHRAWQPVTSPDRFLCRVHTNVKLIASPEEAYPRQEIPGYAGKK